MVICQEPATPVDLRLVKDQVHLIIFFLIKMCKKRRLKKMCKELISSSFEENGY
jgi:hypothetical protein